MFNKNLYNYYYLFLIESDIQTRLNHEKILILLPLLSLLSGCAESIALLGTSTSNGKIVQSSLNSAISYGSKNKQEKLLRTRNCIYGEKNPEKKRILAFHLLKNQDLNFAQLLKNKYH